MEVKEHDSQHLVMRPTAGDRLWQIFLFPIFLLFGFTNKFVIDKLSENIIIEERGFMLSLKKRVIPFSAVDQVTINHIIRLEGGSR